MTVKSASALPVMSEFEEFYRDQIFSSALPPYKPPAYSELTDKDFHVCLDCGDRFILESSLSFHLSRQSVTISYFCKQCDSRLNFQNRCSLLSHLRLHPNSNERTLSITISPLPVNSNEDNDKRISDKNGDEELSRHEDPASEKGSSSQEENAQISANKSSDVNDLVSELSKTSPTGKPFKCRECDTEVENLKTHFLGDNKPTNPHIKCQTCDHILPTKCNLKAHMRIHLKKYPFVCPDCMKEFAFYELFMVHLRYFCFHLEKCARFKCQGCPGIFPTLTSLEVHLATRHVKPVFKCLACPRAFFEQRLLNDHKLQSHGELKIATKFFEQCQLCPQKLLTKNCLFFHIHEHVMNKNVCFYCYKCSNCKYVTDTKLNFASHRLTCPSSEKDVNAHALAKLAKSSLSGEGENSCLTNTKKSGDNLTNSKKPVAVCHPSHSPSNQSMSESLRQLTNGPALLSKMSTMDKKSQALMMILGQQRNIMRGIIDSGILKQCNWHPKVCLMCQNELTLGQQFARYNCPPNYEGCQKWKDTEDENDFGNLVPKINKSNKKNCMAFNGPSKRSKSPPSSPESSSYLCHICNQSLQINPTFIQNHFRQEHPDVELMSLYPMTYKFDLPKISKVPLEALKFSLKKGKFYQTVTVKARMPAASKKIHQDGKRNLMKLKQSMLQNHNSLMRSWLVCSKCTFKTKSRITYKKHLVSHRPAFHECPECGLSFAAEPSLKKHLILHHGGACVNKKEEKVKENVSKEILEKNAGEELRVGSAVEEFLGDANSDSFSCKVCRKSFDSGSDLQKHFRIHGMAFLLLNKDESVWRKV
ncbi:hypothetical protein J437_LFUL010403 [Ladona fulva]|uniref:C2H2-type domain-containing protein n=1 Tax=Ladona fulva TaxID=123851 RepID=A0A8K0P216_LADFU|nr:hypothetical protein J437_LFUL010403 [Ladona fulva]